MKQEKLYLLLHSVCGPDLLMDTPAAREGFMNGVIYGHLLREMNIATDPETVVPMAAQAYAVSSLLRKRKDDVDRVFSEEQKKIALELISVLRRAYLEGGRDPKIVQLVSDMLTAVTPAPEPTYSLEQLTGEWWAGR